MGGILGIVNPLALFLGIPLLAGLVYAYLRKKRLPIITIPSLFLLKDLSLPISTRRKFSPPWRFWFELLILSLLLLCLAGLFSTKESTRYAVVFDNSLSLAAVTAKGRMVDLQRADMQRVLSALPGGSLFDLYTTSPHLERVGGRDLSAASLYQLAGEIEPIYARDSIAEVTGTVGQREMYSGIMVFTDRPLGLDPGQQGSAGAVSIHQIMGERKNIALLNPVQKDQELQFVIQSFGNTDQVSGVVALEGLNSTGSWQEIERKPFLVRDGEESKIEFSLISTQSTALRVTIVEPKPHAMHNALAEDDSLFFSSERSQPGVQVFSLRSLEQLGIKKIKGIRFAAAKIEEYESVRAQFPSDIFLFVDSVPQGLPDRGTIVISPPHSSGGFEIGEIVPQAEVSEWLNGHPLLTYIDVSTLRLSKFIPISSPIWGTSVIATVRGSVLIAGERAGNRYTVAGFDLFPYRGRGAPTQSVLFLNMLRWVSAGRAASDFTPPYERLLATVTGTTFSELGVSKSLLQAEGGSVRPSFLPVHPGIYQLRDPAGVEQISVVNFVDREESQLSIGEREINLSPAKGVQPGAKIETRRALSDFAIPLILIMLAVDFLIALLLPLRGVTRLAFLKRRA